MATQSRPPRWTTSVVRDGTRVSIPARRNGLALLFLVVWLRGWASGEVGAARVILHPGGAPIGFMAFWFVGWTLAGAGAFAALVWQLFGRETITVGRGSLVHRIGVLGVGRRRSYRAAEIRNLRPTASPAEAPADRPGEPRAPLAPSGAGGVTFDCGARTIRIGLSLEDAEAGRLVRELSAHLGR